VDLLDITAVPSLGLGYQPTGMAWVSEPAILQGKAHTIVQ
jgi:hypothetical protein